MLRPTRREILKYGIGGAAALALRPTRGATEDGSSLPSSPSTTPFLDPLPIPPITRPSPPFESPTWADLTDPAQTHFFQLVVEEALVQFHAQLPATRVWRYRDATVPVEQYPAIVTGPTFQTRMVPNHQQGNLVRNFNTLPPHHKGFGHPDQTTHLHGGHHPALSDGFPDDTFFEGQPFRVVYRPGEFFDYFYPNTDAGVGIVGFGPDDPDPGERPSSLWYHDHLLDFTGANVYRGLAGFHFVFDELDTGNEQTGLRLPSGPFDIPLALQDKRFAADGSLVFDQFDFDGFLGDKFVVNGKIQPFLRVKRRKYRFRVLDGSNARFYQIFLTDSSGKSYPMIQIGRDSTLLSAPVQIPNFLFGNANRVEVIIDFADPRFDGVSTLFLENRLEQDDGRGPDGDLEDPELVVPGVRLLKFILEERVPDPSQVPPTLRPFAPITLAEINAARRREFVYERSHGQWVINGQLADIDDPMAKPEAHGAEIWHLVNKSGGWWHPIHTHLENGRVLKRNGSVPNLPYHVERDGVAKPDTVVLGPNSEVDVYLRFRDYCGPFVNHCHNTEHEDHAMMFRWDVVGHIPNDCFFRGR